MKKGFSLVEALITFLILVIIIAAMTSASIIVIRTVSRQSERTIALNISKSLLTEASGTNFNTYYDYIKSDLPGKYSAPVLINLYDYSLNPPIINNGFSFNNVLTNLKQGLNKLYIVKCFLYISPVPKASATDLSNPNSFSSTKVSIKIVLVWGKTQKRFELSTVINEKDAGISGKVFIPLPSSIPSPTSTPSP